MNTADNISTVETEVKVISGDNQPTIDTETEINHDDVESTVDSEAQTNSVDNEVTFDSDEEINNADNKSTGESEVEISSANNQASIDTEAKINRSDNEVTVETEVRINSTKYETTVDSETQLNSANNELTIDTEAEISTADNKPTVETGLKIVSADIDSTVDSEAQVKNADNEVTIDTEAQINKAAVETEVQIISADKESIINIEAEINDTDNEVTVDREGQVNSADNEVAIDTEVEINTTDNEPPIEIEVELISADNEPTIDSEAEINCTNNKGTVESEIRIDRADNNSTVDSEAQVISANNELTIDNETEINRADNKATVETEVKIVSADRKATVNTEAEINHAVNEAEIKINSTDNESTIESEIQGNSDENEVTIDTETGINSVDNEETLEILNHANEVNDHDYSNTTVEKEIPEESVSDGKSRTGSPEREISPPREDLPKSEDSLRDVLRMQLSSLRNMKKSTEYLPELKNKSIFFDTIKKKRKPCDLISVTSLPPSDKIEEDRTKDEEICSSESTVGLFPASDVNEENSVNKKQKSSDENVSEIETNNEENEQPSGEAKEGTQLLETDKQVDWDKNCSQIVHSAEEINEDTLVSTTNETKFLIVNVEGGVEDFSDDESDERNCKELYDSESTKSLHNSCDVSPRTQIRNILTNVSNRRKRNTFPNIHEEKLTCNLSVKKDLSVNFNEDPGIKKSTKSSEKSPFVSDSLEDFLNESSQLKISYPIPKLGAEEGITTKTQKSPYEDINNSSLSRIARLDSGTDSETPQIQKEKPKLVKKAKTLAEMRRRFEKMKAKQEAVAKKEEILAKKEQTENVKTKVEDVATPVPVLSNRNCYLVYDNKKILLTGNTNSKCVTNINSKQEKEILNEKPSQSHQTKISIIRRPSLLSSLGENKTTKIKYKPGPLCKKVDLQNIESRDNWTTELKSLPKIFLEIAPEKDKPVDPKIVHLLPIFDNPEITEERLDFALSALKTSEVNPEPKKFNFHIPYKNNQEQFLVRRRCELKVSTKNLTKDDSNPENEINNILKDIITYVETKEIENTLVKDEEPISQDVLEKPEEKDNSVKDKNKKRRRKKIDIELSRLSCKVIDVGSTKSEDKDCSKPYCRLGCICKSLLCDSVFSNHCQLLECMFECKCPPVLSNDNNALSAYTVNHLEDKAKKNLARVEREFTQTVIHTDDNMILVGSGKNRRSSKPPKKYNDYVADNTIFECSRPSNNLPLKKFSLVVQKLDLNGLVPYCMFHNVHNCYCKGEMTDFPTRKRTLRVETIEHSPSKKTKVDNHIPRMRIVTTKYQNKSWSESCARVRKIFSQYRKRNEDPLYNKKLRKNLVINRLPESIEELEVDIDVIGPLDNKSGDNKKPSKRKQSFNVREDTVLLSTTSQCDQEKEFALQRRKKKMKTLPTSKEPSTYYSIFDGEIKVSLKENTQMLDILGEPNSSSLEYLRMLPWMKLIQGFQSRKINIWAKESLTSALLCNGAGYFPPKNFVDIRILKYQYRTPIISWILSNSLPHDKSAEHMRLILKPKNGHFAIAGYCMKKLNDGEISNSDNNDATCEEGNCASPKRSESRSSIEIEEDIDEQQENNNLEEVTSSKQRNNFVNKKSVDRTITQYETKTTQKIISKIETEKMKEFPNIKQLEVFRNRKQSVKLASMNKCQTQEKRIKMKSILNPEILKKNTNLASSQEIMPTLTSVTTDHNIGIAKSSESSNSVANDRSKETSPNDSATGDKRSLLPSRTLKCTHKDMHNQNKTLFIAYKEFPKRQLYFHKHESQGELSLALPKVSKNFKWWMIYLNSDFSYLCFDKSNYSMKYTDLLDVVKMSNNIKSTITLRNKEFSDKYKHPLFGIFCCPDYRDRLFIGPFLPSEKHHIETFRYLQGKLIRTDMFNKMVGRTDSEKKPMWIYENLIPSANFSNLSNDVIDITEEDEENTVDVINIESDGVENNVDMETCLLCPPFVEELTKEELASRHNINRYIMTNIPHLGYFRACQRDSKAIEVFWPKNIKGYRFPNVTFAKNLLVQYLSLIFCPIPQDFKINVIIMTHIDTQTNTPVDVKYFTQNGPYFCGEFGIYETHQITSDLLDKFSVSSIDSFLESHQNSEEHENTMIKLFGLFLMSNEELRKHTDPQSVLQWASSEIYILKKLHDNYESEKSDLQKMIRLNSCKVRDFRLQKESQSKKVVDQSQTETIEITDSDDESFNTDTNIPKINPIFHKISTSGKLEVASTTSDNNGTSLKPKIWIKPTHSLFNTDHNKQNKPSGSDEKAVTISLKNSNIVLNKNKLLITKIQ